MRYRAVLRRWAFRPKLEQAYERAAEKYDHLAQRTIGGQMERFAHALKRDPQLDRLLRQRGPELGIVEGSRLTLVVQSEKLDRALTRELGLRHGLGMGM